MTDAIHDYKAIGRRFNRQDQKAESEAKNPLPTSKPVVWTPEHGYSKP